MAQLKHYVYKERIVSSNLLFIPKCPSVDERMKRLWYTYTMEYYSAVKRKKILPFATAWVDLENIMLNEISQLEKDKYHMILPMWNVLNELN